MKPLRTHKIRGISLTELMLAIAILLGVLSVARVAVDLIRGLLKQSSLIEIERESQLQLYNITRDIRNARDIVTVSAVNNTLVLQVYDLRRGFDSQDSPMFDAATFGTITYQYMPNENPPYLLRREEFGPLPAQGPHPALDPINREKKILTNLLSPDVDTPVFSAYPDPSDVDGPFDSVRVILRLGKGWWTTSPRLYEAVAMKRAFGAG